MVDETQDPTLWAIFARPALEGADRKLVGVTSTEEEAQRYLPWIEERGEYGEIVAYAPRLDTADPIQTG